MTLFISATVDFFPSLWVHVLTPCLNSDLFLSDNNKKKQNQKTPTTCMTNRWFKSLGQSQQSNNLFQRCDVTLYSKFTPAFPLNKRVFLNLSYISFLGHGQQMHIPHYLHIEWVLQRQEKSKVHQTAEQLSHKLTSILFYFSWWKTCCKHSEDFYFPYYVSSTRQQNCKMPTQPFCVMRFSRQKLFEVRDKVV